MIGSAGSIHMMQILQHNLKVHPKAEGVDASTYVCSQFIAGARDALKTHGFMTVNNSTESGGDFVVSCKGRLFRVHDHFAAIGCGGISRWARWWRSNPMSASSSRSK